MIVVALSKHNFKAYINEKGITTENVELLNDVAFISINDQNSSTLPPFPEGHKNVKTLIFADADFDKVVPIIGANRNELIKAFTIEQARDLYSFIVVNSHKKVMMIHCTMGISRSGAVAAFISDLSHENYMDLKNRNPQIIPNVHVLKLLRQVDYEQTKSFEPFWLETEKRYFGMVDANELNVIRHIHPDFSEFLNYKSKIDTQDTFLSFGHGPEYNSSITLLQWLTAKGMLGYFLSFRKQTQL